jgi:Kef-type K+ transport system membrane component KefB
MPDVSLNTKLFVAGTLTATSVGITANVLQDMGRGESREGLIVVGAAVFDDILGLVILAVVSGIVVSGSINVTEIATVIVVSSLFLVATAALGPMIVRFMATLLRRLDVVETKMFTSFLFVMLLAWMANLAGLATIIGKLASGLGAFQSSSKWLIGVGMVPRGEVGLVFAAIGRTLGVIDDSVFAAIALMIIVTTVIAPPWLKILVNRQIAREGR